MDCYAVLGQAVGIIAMILSALSFQMKTHKKIMIMQMITAFVFATHYFMIGGIAAAVSNAIAIIRDVVFYHKDKKFFSGKIWTVLFAFIMAVMAVVSGMMAGEGFVCSFMAAGIVLNTLSFSFTNPQSVRRVILISSPFMLLYNICTLSAGGIINEVISATSSLIALIRYRKNSST